MGGEGLARGLAREPKGVRSAGRGAWPGLRLSAACGGGIWGGWSCRPSEHVTFPPMGCDLRRSPLSPRLGSRPEFRRAPEMAAGTGCLHVALASRPAPSHLEAQSASSWSGTFLTWRPSSWTFLRGQRDGAGVVGGPPVW